MENHIPLIVKASDMRCACLSEQSFKLPLCLLSPQFSPCVPDYLLISSIDFSRSCHKTCKEITAVTSGSLFFIGNVQQCSQKGANSKYCRHHNVQCKQPLPLTKAIPGSKSNVQQETLFSVVSTCTLPITAWWQLEGLLIWCTSTTYLPKCYRKCTIVLKCALLLMSKPESGTVTIIGFWVNNILTSDSDANF